MSSLAYDVSLAGLRLLQSALSSSTRSTNRCKKDLIENRKIKRLFCGGIFVLFLFDFRLRPFIAHLLAGNSQPKDYLGAVARACAFSG
jgi:hypothetical protein